MHATLITPFEILEEVAVGYLDSRVTLDIALEAIEGQFERVTRWLAKLERLPVPDFETGLEMHKLGETANGMMLDGLEMLHVSIEEDDVEGMESAMSALEESHFLLLRSLEISEEIQVDVDDDNARGICSTVI